MSAEGGKRGTLPPWAAETKRDAVRIQEKQSPDAGKDEFLIFLRIIERLLVTMVS